MHLRDVLAMLSSRSPDRTTSERGHTSDAALQYIRFLHSDLSRWHLNANTKAQVILTANGVFIAFLSSSILRDVNEFRSFLQGFKAETWILATITALCLGLSIISAVLALASRGLRSKRLVRVYKEYGVEPDDASSYKPEVMAHFFLISGLQRSQFVSRVATVDSSFELRALANDSYVFTHFLLTTYNWVNRGFIFMGGTFLFFLATVADYTIRLAR
jgi:hypothetical protein